MSSPYISKGPDPRRSLERLDYIKTQIPLLTDKHLGQLEQFVADELLQREWERQKNEP